METNSIIIRTPAGLAPKLATQVNAYAKLFNAETTSEKKRAVILATINNKELFKPDFKSFSAFCEEVLGLKKSNVSRILSTEKRFNTEKYAFLWNSAFPISWMYELKDSSDEELLRFGIVEGFSPSEFSRDKIRKLVNGEKSTIDVPADKTKVKSAEPTAEPTAEPIAEPTDTVEEFKTFEECIEHLSQLVADRIAFTVTYGETGIYVRRPR